jgi:hypothetical protein
MQHACVFGILPLSAAPDAEDRPATKGGHPTAPSTWRGTAASDAAGVVRLCCLRRWARLLTQCKVHVDVSFHFHGLSIK